MKQFIWALFMVAGALQAHAANENPTGYEIVRENERRNSGYIDSESDVTMVLQEKGKKVSERLLSLFSREIADDGDRSLIVIKKPFSQRGIALLGWSHKEAVGEQWLYLPALKKVKKIRTSDKSGSFMGSEFSYEDLSDPEIDKYEYKYLGEEKLDEQDVFLVERTPSKIKSSYSKWVMYIDKQHYRTLKMDYFDKKGKISKTLYLEKYELFNQYWRPRKSTMKNNVNGKSTLMLLDSFKNDLNLKENLFTRNGLKNISLLRGY